MDEKTEAIGITSKQGRYAATFAHSDIAFEFASWISPELKLYIIKNISLNANTKQMMRSLLDNAGTERLKQLEPSKK